ncbi:nucleotidyltransferase domain-containing protein [Aliagarivorans marinus]|uniref:nucleotidyltransferase domain-containing protein n=1 Tax=Aliagarivorans marinus TaxID=561965 RepID=UPI000557FF14|nr:nucleotidyltransferase domain-containing protein [Aliagarivorans marinus]
MLKDLFEKIIKRSCVEVDILPEQTEPRETEAICKDLTKALTEELKKEDGFKALYLYGSRARGDHHDSSDHDFYVVFEDHVDDTMEFVHIDNAFVRNKIKKNLAARGISTNFDLMMSKVRRFERLAKEDGSHAQQCLDYGVLIYSTT